MGLPQIIIEFKTAGGSAVRRSARGQVVLLIPGEESGSAEYTSLPGEKPAGLSALGWRAVRLAMLGGPGKVVVRRYVPGTEEETLEDCAPAAEGGWLCAPWMDGDAVAALVRKKRAAGSPLRAVVEAGDGHDCAGVVDLATQGIWVRLDEGAESVPTAQYCARVAGILAGLSLKESATYHPLPEVTDITLSGDQEGDIQQGRLILDRGAQGVRLGRAVTSLVTLESPGDAAFQKIKITEGMDLIRADIRSVFESEYVGKVLNDYDSKLLLVTAINSYFAGLEGSVLDTGRKNRAAVDYKAQKSWLESRGVDTGSMSETAILSANTGSQVFLTAQVWFADAMEDLCFTITM